MSEEYYGWKKYNDLNFRDKIIRFKIVLESEVSKSYFFYALMKKLKLDLVEVLREEEFFWR